jgi:uncharacterized protein with FMN-binding domain
MRRAIAAIISTTVGLVLLLSFKSHAGSVGPGISGLIHRAPTPTPTPSTHPSSKAKATQQPQKKTTETSRTITGDTIDTQYGPVQVSVSLTGSHINDVNALRLPQATSHDVEIDNFAVPRLRQEALDAQSAQIDSVSGATFTSDGYIRSLQSALDKAGG